MGVEEIMFVIVVWLWKRLYVNVVWLWRRLILLLYGCGGNISLLLLYGLGETYVRYFCMARRKYIFVIVVWLRGDTCLLM